MLEFTLECPRCGQIDLLKNFGYFDNRSQTRKYPELCNQCAKFKANASSKEYEKRRYRRIQESEELWQDRNEQARKRFLKNFGLTPEEYNEMLAKQNGVCACCGRPETVLTAKSRKVRSLAVDHDHETGKVRALLCGACNSALGMFEEDPERIKRLVAYAIWCRSLKQ